jgi:hypothetical protein
VAEDQGQRDASEAGEGLTLHAVDLDHTASPGPPPRVGLNRDVSSNAIRAHAREGFRSAGRGVVVTFDDQEDVRYSTIEELRGALAKAPELAALFEVAANAVACYDPEREAVVLESGLDAVSVFLVRETEVIALGTLAFVTPT